MVLQASMEPLLCDSEPPQAREPLVGKNEVRIRPPSSFGEFLCFKMAVLFEFLPCALEPVVRPSKRRDSIGRIEARALVHALQQPLLSEGKALSSPTLFSPGEGQGMQRYRVTCNHSGSQFVKYLAHHHHLLVGAVQPFQCTACALPVCRDGW